MPDPNNPNVQIPNPNYPGNLGTNCQNCYAIPHGTGSDWDPGAGGIGPLLPGSAPTLDWAIFNDPANRGTNGTRNVFNPYDITYYSAGIQYTGGAITVDQRLTSNISFYGEGFWGMRRAQFVNNDTGHQITYRGSDLQPVLSDKRAPESSRRVPHGHRAAFVHRRRSRWRSAISSA